LNEKTKTKKTERKWITIFPLEEIANKLHPQDECSEKLQFATTT